MSAPRLRWSDMRGLDDTIDLTLPSQLGLAYVGKIRQTQRRPNTYLAVSFVGTHKPFTNLRRAKAWLKRAVREELAAVAQRGRAA